MARCPPGSHPLRQGLAYIVILDFDSAVIRMMLKDENNRFMVLRVRSERTCHIFANVHYLAPLIIQDYCLHL